MAGHSVEDHSADQMGGRWVDRTGDRWVDQMGDRTGDCSEGYQFPFRERRRREALRLRYTAVCRSVDHLMGRSADIPRPEGEERRSARPYPRGRRVVDQFHRSKGVRRREQASLQR
jgi:hypothetical protein